MLKKFLFFIRTVCLIIVILAVIIAGTRIITPKYYTNNMWATTSTFEGFYELEENSIDLLFMGSSHAAAAFVPSVFTEETGLSAYNLSCEQQNTFTTYYWLREALQTQKPEYLVLDTFILFDFEPEEPLNTDENCTRKAFENMAWSDNKWEAINELEKLDPKQDKLSYIFPYFRYHNRWTELKPEDFYYDESEEREQRRGYEPLDFVLGDSNYAGIWNPEETERAKMVPIMETYLDKIVELCKENNIEIILVKTPTMAWDVQRHNTVADYAAKNSLEFIDFNNFETYRASEFDFNQDMSEFSHANLSGAKKLTRFIAKTIAKM